MCLSCGCGQPESKDGDHHHHHGHRHSHRQGSGEGPGRLLEVELDILAANDRYAAENRKFFRQRGIFAVNLVSSPGSGKTTLLVRTIQDLKHRLSFFVVEGDQQTDLDAERIRATGVPAAQVNTGKGCHLDAHMVAHALEELEIAENGVLLIENVGNLICPAPFDLGEAHKVVVLSVTEGEDKPLKYPDIFAAADLMVLNKSDLLAHVSFDADKCEEYARQINPGIGVVRLSALTGDGMESWYDWIDGSRAPSH